MDQLRENIPMHAAYWKRGESACLSDEKDHWEENFWKIFAWALGDSARDCEFEGGIILVSFVFVKGFMARLVLDCAHKLDKLGLKNVKQELAIVKSYVPSVIARIFDRLL